MKSENDGENESLRDAQSFAITGAEYDSFVRMHQHQPALIKEPNEIMKSSYLILDEYMRFLDKAATCKSTSILGVDVEVALAQVKWDFEAFQERSGEYDWSRELDLTNDEDVATNNSTCSSLDKTLEW